MAEDGANPETDGGLHSYRKPLDSIRSDIKVMEGRESELLRDLDHVREDLSKMRKVEEAMAELVGEKSLHGRPEGAQVVRYGHDRDLLARILEAVLEDEGRPMTAAELAQIPRVRDSFGDKSFKDEKYGINNAIINMMLSRPERFEKVARGTWALVGGKED